MPISRALLNRLRLPYKALDIQGSKGDVLYVPDDVGIDLSVMHGVHNGDMVPVKTDNGGVVSVAVDSLLGSVTRKNNIVVTTAMPVFDDIRTLTFDTSEYLNYIFRARVVASNDNTSTITIHVGRNWTHTGHDIVLTFTLNATIGIAHTFMMLSSDNTVSTTSTFIDSVLDHSTKQAQVYFEGVGYN